MKSIIITFFCFYLVFTGYALTQNIMPKVSLDLMFILQDSSQNFKENAFLPVLIKGNIQAIKNLHKDKESVCKWCLNDICAVELKLTEIDFFLQEKGVWQIDYTWAKAQKLHLPDDTIHLQHNHITPVHLGENPLPKTYKGNGVLIGVVDDGFELKHPDFLNIDSSTRVQYLWDQSDDHNTYTHNLNYGSLWTKNNIDSNSCRQIPLAHGTHVLGIAAGNAQASGKYIGVAPNADLLLVKIEENNTAFLARFVDAIYFFANKSTELNKPCVINSSVGVYGSSRDGKDLYSQAIQAILLHQNGLSLVQAAGNAREATMHLNTQLNIGDTAKTAFDYNTNTRRTNFFIYADTTDFKAINFAMQQVQGINNQVLHQSQTFAINTDFFTPNNTSSRYRKPFVVTATDTLSYMDISIANYNGVYQILLQIIQAPNSINNTYWQLLSTGEGKFDIYASANYLGTSNIKNNINTPHYRSAEQKQNIVGYWTCLDEVIAVAAYQNQSQMINYIGDTISLQTANYFEGGIAPFSSIGLTRDGRQKPDIAASGGQVISAATLADIDYYKRIGYQYLNEDAWHVSNRGTSMAAPFVAGALALYYECNPTANNIEIRQALYNSARLDSFVFQQSRVLPNAHWGYGKLDVFNLIKSCLIYGCTDSLATNYNPLANVENGSCYLSSISENNKNNTFKIYPNPAQKHRNINYEIPENYAQSYLVVYNLQGQVLAEYFLENEKGSLVFDNFLIPAQQLLFIQILKENLQPLYYKGLLIIE